MREVVEVKVNPKDQDPDTDQMGDQTTIVVGNPIVKDSKAPSTSCPHGDDKTIIQGHASKEIKNHKEEEQTQVQEVENLSRVF